jgi:hypothetical protein
VAGTRFVRAMKRLILAVVLWVGLALGNFGYALVISHRYGVALERSFFQAIAVATTYGMLCWWERHREEL